MSKSNNNSLVFSEFDTRRHAKIEGNPEKGKSRNKESILIQSAIHNANGYKQAVMVVSSFGKSKSQSASYVKYMTQENTTPLYNKEGNEISEEEGIEIVDQWIEDTKKRKGTTRYTMHLVLQSEPDADPEKAKKGMEDFLKKEFDKNDYLYVIHTDKDSPHMHVSIKMQGDDKKKIQATKSDLKDWRYNYAESMREQGFEYTATSRVSRLKKGKSLSPSSKIKFGFYGKEILDGTERKHDQENIQKWKDAYTKIAKHLSKSNSMELIETANKINEYTKDRTLEK